jgi:hypothetical protein
LCGRVISSEIFRNSAARCNIRAPENEKTSLAPLPVSAVIPRQPLRNQTMFSKIAKIVFYLYTAAAVIYLVISAIVLAGPSGLIISPETAIPALFIGAPWSLGALALISGKEDAVALFTLLGVIPMGINFFLLWLLQRWLARKGV